MTDSAQDEQLTVIEVAAADWDAFVSRSDQSSFAHLSAWRNIIESSMGHEALYRGVRRQNDLVAVLPLYRVRSRVFGQHLISVPFLNYGGPVGDRDAVEFLARWAVEQAGQLGAASVQLRTRARIGAGIPTSESKVVVVLPLADDAERMWMKEFSAKFRNKIKRPQRDGMTTRFGNDQIRAFYDIFAATMRDLGTPTLPLRFFEAVIEDLGSTTLLGVTYWNDRPVAAGLGFMWRDEFEMTWSASLHELRAAKPNMLLYWDFMRELIGRGQRRFNFGRSTPGSGTHEFKLSWGGVDESLPWMQWPDRASSDPGRLARAASMVWRRLPVPIANRLGPIVARQLPWW